MKMLLWRAFGVLLMLTALAVPLTRAPDRGVETLVARWAPPPSDFVEVKGQIVHLRDEGPRDDPVPIVLIHGTSASLHTWEGWVAALRGQRRVITFDLPGFGLTGPFAGQYPPDDYRGDTLARFTIDLMDQLKLGKVVVGGNSLGGEVAWRLASLAPQRVDKLILVDATGYDFTPDDMPIGFRLARLPVVSRLSEYFLPRSMVEASVLSVYGDPAKVSSALVDRYFDLTLREGNRRALRLRMQQLEMGQQVARIAQLKVPTLILWGAKDRLVPPAYGQRFAKDIAGSRLAVFPELGHVPMEEDPGRSSDMVKEFLGLQLR